MSLRVLAATLLAALTACATATVDHDKLEAFPQPEPVTVSEKAAIKFKSLLNTPINVCVPYPAVNTAGETGGLKRTNGNDACTYATKGSQIYGRAGWYKDVWGIMYAWYFTKGFNWMESPSRRHDWKSVVVWIDNPDLETPKIVGVSLSKSDSKYKKEMIMYPSYFAGQRLEGPVRNLTYIDGSKTSLRFKYEFNWGACINFAGGGGEYQDLIMWEQLTDAARVALNDNDNFGTAEVPFSDEHYQDHLDNAWPL